MRDRHKKRILHERRREIKGEIFGMKKSGHFMKLELDLTNKIFK